MAPRKAFPFPRLLDIVRTSLTQAVLTCDRRNGEWRRFSSGGSGGGRRGGGEGATSSGDGCDVIKGVDDDVNGAGGVGNGAGGGGVGCDATRGGVVCDAPDPT